MVLGIHEVKARFDKLPLVGPPHDPRGFMGMEEAPKKVHASQHLVGHRKKVHTLQFNKGGIQLASGSMDCTVRIWPTIESGISIMSNELKGHTNTVNQLCWNPMNDHQLATCSYDRTTRLWDVRHKGHETHQIKTSGELINIAWSPCGSYIAVGNDADQISFIDVRKAAIMKTKSFKYEINEFQWSPNSKYFLLGAGQGAGTLEVYSFPKMERMRIVEAHTGSTYCLKIDPSNQHLALGSQDGLVSIWDLENLMSLRTMDRFGSSVRTIAWSGDGRMLASGSEEPNIDIMEVVTGKQVASIKTEDGTNALAWHPKRLLIAWAGEGQWTPDDRRRKEEFPYIKFLSLSSLSSGAPAFTPSSAAAAGGSSATAGGGGGGGMAGSSLPNLGSSNTLNGF